MIESRISCSDGEAAALTLARGGRSVGSGLRLIASSASSSLADTVPICRSRSETSQTTRTVVSVAALLNTRKSAFTSKLTHKPPLPIETLAVASHLFGNGRPAIRSMCCKVIKSAEKRSKVIVGETSGANVAVSKGARSVVTLLLRLEND